MAETLTAPASNGVPARRAPVSTGARKQELARALDEKRAQGFLVESESEAGAILAIRGRPRWFGLSHGVGARYEITVDERGRAKSRRL